MDAPDTQRPVWSFPSERLRALPYLLLLIAFVARLAFGYETDELQHLHFAWNLSHGQIPYHDFFEHHPPGLHALLSPLIANEKTADFTLLFLLRLGVLAVIGTGVALFFRSLRTEVPPSFAYMGAACWILTPPFQIVGIELRPDTLAVTLVLSALLLIHLALVQKSKRSKGKQLLLFASSGILIGYADITTQKAWFLTVGIIVWFVAGLIFSPRGKGRSPFHFAIFLIGLALPMVSLYAKFSRIGAGHDLLEGVLLGNLHWKPDFVLRHSLQEILLVAFPIYTIAYSELVRRLSSVRQMFQEFSVASQMVSLLLVGTLALLKTPSPTPQSVFLFTGPWAVYLAILGTHRYAVNPELLLNDRRRIGWAAAFTLLGLYWYNALIVVIVYGSVLAFVWRRSHRESKINKIYFSGRAILAIALLAFVIRAVGDLKSHKASSKLQFAAYVEEIVPPGEPILETWPLIAPFHPIPVFHGFVPYGILLNEPAGTIEKEYETALATNQRMTIIANPEELKEFLPKFSASLGTSIEKLEGTPPYPGGLFVYRIDSHGLRK